MPEFVDVKVVESETEVSRIKPREEGKNQIKCLLFLQEPISSEATEADSQEADPNFLEPCIYGPYLLLLSDFSSK